MQNLLNSWNTTTPSVAKCDAKYEEVSQAQIEDMESQMQPTCALLPRSESMEMINDPRFFSTSVIEKRLTAFQGLSVLGTLFVSSSIMQLYELKKNMEFATLIGWLQFLGFAGHLLVTFMLITAVFVYVQQTFYTYRLLTAGPTGFEQASLFYLNEAMTSWRHFAMNSMMSGIPGFMLASGCVMLVKFVKDGQTTYNAQLMELAGHLNATKVMPAFRHFMSGEDTDGMALGTLKRDWEAWKLENKVDYEAVPPLISMQKHWTAAIVVFVAILCFCAFLARIRSQHIAAYQLMHLHAQDRVDKLTTPLRTVNSTNRRGRLLEA